LSAATGFGFNAGIAATINKKFFRKNSQDGYAKISSYKAWCFFGGEGIHQVCRGPEKTP
jgi:hypothetical protein